MSKSATKALLSRAKPRVEPFEVRIDLGDQAFQDYNDLVMSLGELPDPPKEGDDPDAERRADLQQQIVAAHDALQQRVVRGKLTVLPLLRWEALIAEHPPREDHPRDLALGFQPEGYPVIVRACVVDPVLDDADWEALHRSVSLADWYRLADQCRALNERTVSIPKLPSDFLRPQRPASV